MSDSQSKLLTVEKPRARYQEQVQPQARNPIYSRSISVGCPFCVSNKARGRKRNYKTLWCLYQHFTHHHKEESTYKDLTMQLAELIIRGVLLEV